MAGALALMIGIGLLLVAGGWLVISINNRAADGQLKPNGWAGIRTKATMSSPEAWQAAHQAGRQLSVWGGWLLAASGPLGLAIGLLLGDGDPDSSIAVWGVVVMVTTVVVTGMVVAGALQGHRAAAEVRDS